MEIASQYRSLKPYLFATAYNITGQVHEAEDIVQDAFEDVLNKKDPDVQNVKSYLTRIVINKSIDRLNTLKKAREEYPSLWLPEPYITEAENPQYADVLPYAFLYLIELLNPVERAVFILRESFGKSYDEIASLCGVTVDNCRQVLRRARVKMKQAAQSPGDNQGPSNEELVQEFLLACLTGNTNRLSELLKQDVILYSDGGGKVVAARKILEGFSKVTKFLTGIINKTLEKWSGARRIIVNNQPALLIPDGDGIYMVLIPQAEGGKLARLFIMRNPDKIFLSDPVTK
jgi:RNA polymerase sigma-70 factor, ECF subfamily